MHALTLYLDAACTQPFLAQQVFAGNGSTTAFNLTNMTGAQLGSVRCEIQTTVSGVTFASGVGSGFSGLTVNALIGQRVMFNGQFIGTVTANTATTASISNTGYTNATPGNCVTSACPKLVLGTDYTVSGNTITTLFTPTSSQNIYAVPAAALGATYGGAAGTVKTTQTKFYMRRSPITGGGSLYVYTGLTLTSQDLSVPYQSLTQTAVSFASGVGSGFSALVSGALVGRAVIHNGLFVGTVTANTTTTVTINNTGYTGASASATVFNTGSVLFAPDVSGAPGVYAQALNPSDINDDTIYAFWVEDTITVPTGATNYVNNAIVALGQEAEA